ncbi:HAD family phosphatase [Pseudoxanthomonas sp.]|jgi:HAD superfamily phosphoserine phosphatase-like hydrolase|uniref:HAD family phosphatase n=1 Tax=Pseudoxanthomonas sp. TaxID=1871049 RepID=UPI002E113468|nr:HAD family phosphatase [Pseudoxanthomonas sp.]
MSRTAYCFDLDGTLTSAEILPCIAAELGISEEIATLTRITMEGLLTFEESLRLRVAILGQVPLQAVHAIVNDIRLDPQLTTFIQSRPDQCFIVTGNLDIWVKQLIDRIGCDGYTSLATAKNGMISLRHILDKGEAVKSVRNRGFERVIAIGDGSNDVPMFRAADTAIAFGGIHSPMPAAVAESNFVVHDGDALCKLLNTL